MNLDRRACFRRAEKLLGSDAPENLLYACLELRYCIEAICYSKAKLLKKQLPQDALKTWQPKKLIDMLVEYDPHVDQDFEFRIWTENQDGTPDKMVFDGTHKTLPTEVLRKHYYKLGSYLHVPTVSQETQTPIAVRSAELKKYLGELMPMIRPSALNRIDSSIAQTASIDCEECGHFIVRNLEAIEKNPEVICPNSSCEARYEVTLKDGDNFWKILQYDFDCPSCGPKNYFPKHVLSPGFKVSCAECEKPYEFFLSWHLRENKETE